MDRFKVYRLREKDKKVSAAFEQTTLDELDPGEVVIRVAYSDVNYKDALAATGAGKIVRRFPCIGGHRSLRHRGRVERLALQEGRRGHRDQLRHRRGARRRLCASMRGSRPTGSSPCPKA